MAKFDRATYDKEYRKVHKAEIKKRKHLKYIENKEALVKKQLLWQQENKEKYRRYQKEYHRTYKDKSQVARISAWKQKYPEKCNAYRVIDYAKQRRLIKQESCAVCNKTKTECHHFDYTLPLCVVHLCRECHRKIHSGEINEKQIQEVFVYEI